jgi:hypothetical protein
MSKSRFYFFNTIQLLIVLFCLFYLCAQIYSDYVVYHYLLRSSTLFSSVVNSDSVFLLIIIVLNGFRRKIGPWIALYFMLLALPKSLALLFLKQMISYGMQIDLANKIEAVSSLIVVLLALILIVRFVLLAMTERQPSQLLGYFYCRVSFLNSILLHCFMVCFILLGLLILKKFGYQSMPGPNWWGDFIFFIFMGFFIAYRLLKLHVSWLILELLGLVALSPLLFGLFSAGVVPFSLSMAWLGICSLFFLIFFVACFQGVLFIRMRYYDLSSVDLTHKNIGLLNWVVAGVVVALVWGMSFQVQLQLEMIDAYNHTVSFTGIVPQSTSLVKNLQNLLKNDRHITDLRVVGNFF